MSPRPHQPAVTVALTVMLLGSAAHAGVIDYRPELGTLPSAQGWDVFATGGVETGAVVDSVLVYGPSSTPEVNFWEHAFDTPVDFSAGVWSIEADVELTGTTLGNVSGFRRGGFGLFLSDDAGSGIVAEFGDNGISLRNDNSGATDPIETVDLTDGFTTLRLEAGPDGGRLLVDGVERLTLPLGFFGSNGTTSWGEFSTLASTTQTRVAGVRVVPAPGAAALALVAGLAATRRRR